VYGINRIQVYSINRFQFTMNNASPYKLP
jgi:hypothetical protein